MSIRAIRSAELTPDARIARAKRLIAEAIADLVDAQVAKGVTASEWIDQDASPLGRHRHLLLVRKGVLKGVREGKKVLVRRGELETYLNAHRARTVEDDEDVSGMCDAIQAGARR